MVPNGARGFHNTGVICWCNALLQALLSCSAFNEVVRANTGRFGKKVQALSATALEGGDTAQFSAQISALYSAIHGKLSPDQQQCAHEGYIQFMDAIKNPTLDSCFSCAHKHYSKCEKCGAAICPRDVSVSVAVPCCEVADLNEHLRYSVGEVDQFECVCGHVNKNMKRVSALVMAREILVVSFNKYDRKDMIAYPVELKFPSKQDGEHTYKLVASIEHIGGMYGGHYTARVRRRDGWYYCNDTMVVPISGCVPQKNTYMVFYHMV
jgi:ubiquitin C-terminal hydrolase